MRLHQGYAATPGLSTPTRTGDPARVAPMRGAALRACIIRGAEPYRPNQRRSARHPYRSRTVVARCAALILRAPLLIRLRFAADPSGWRPRYHPLRFARIIRCAPRCAARDARTVSRMPGPARRLEIADKAGHPALERLRRFDYARTGETVQDASEMTRALASQPEARTARAPVRWRVWWRAHRRTFTPTDTIRAGASRRFNPRLPGGRRPHTEKPVPRAPVRRRVSWRAHRPAYQPATALRASASRQTPPGTRQEPAASAYRALLRFSTITDPVRIRLRRPGIA